MDRKTIITLLLICATISLGAANRPDGHRPKVGVVLSGGGAKGAAHVGVLRAIEEAGIPIDYIAGTSMGAVVGGLYSMGYSTAQLDTLFRTQDWSFLLSDKAAPRRQSLEERQKSELFLITVPLKSPRKRPEIGGIVRGQNLGNMLARLTVGFHDSISFDSLRTPFACVATNLATGEEVVFHGGSLPIAIRASMAIPGVFTPVQDKGVTLVDGGLANNYPVDVVRAMGADIVIGSTVQREFNDTVQFKNVPDILQQYISISCRKKYEENLKDADLNIRTDAGSVSTMDFSTAAIDTMLRAGYRTAKENWAKLQQISRAVEESGNTDYYKYTRKQQGRPIPQTIGVREARIEDIDPKVASSILKACKLNDSTAVSFSQIEEALRLLHDKFLYTDAYYTLSNASEMYDLTFRTGQRGSSTIGLGARFDTEEMAAVLLNADIVLRTEIPTHIGMRAKLGEQYYGRLTYTAEPALYRRFLLSYELRHADTDVYHDGKREYNVEYNRHLVNLSYSQQNIRNFAAELGARFTVYDYRGVLQKTAEEEGKFKSNAYFTAFASLQYDSQDNAYYPTAGSKFQAEAAFTTNDLRRYTRPNAFYSVAAQWRSVVTIGKRFALLPDISGRIVAGSNIPYAFSNAIGSLQRGKYIEQQMPFPGVGNVEPVRNALATVSMNLRYMLRPRHFVTALLSTGLEGEDIQRFFTGRYFYGVGAKYGCNSKFGPIEASFSYSDVTNKLIFYLSAGFDF